MSNTNNTPGRLKALARNKEQALSTILDEVMVPPPVDFNAALEASLALPLNHRFRIFSLRPMPVIIIDGELRS